MGTGQLQRQVFGGDHHYVAIVSVPAQALLAFLADRFLPGKGLPPLDGHVHVMRLQFYPVANPAAAFASNEAGARAQKRVKHDVPVTAAVLYGAATP